jgi:NADH-quinone oxidoreductase subunit L
MTDITEVCYLRWIPILPLITAAVGGLFGARIQRRMGEGAISALACTPILLAFLLACYAFMNVAGLHHHPYLLDRVAPWISVGNMRADIAFAVDPLTAVMMLIITGIGGLIHVYSTGYMHGDQAYWRFFAYLNLFMFAMLTLVMGDNLLLMFVGWEGVGLCSFALIGFWYEDPEKARAGNKAFIVNRVGDFGFLLGIFLLFWSLEDAAGQGTLVFREIQAGVGAIADKTWLGVSIPVLVTLFFFVGAAGKSAQIPLYVWLPDAMAGPTPVSALIHAATMVTAGVYMIGRLHFLYSLSETTLTVVAVVGAATALLAATIGVAQNDIKKVLAYSTVSQLGYMFMAMGVGAYAAGIFHLVTHAFFKACLFLGSGSVIHGMGGEQDMTKMGGLRQYMPRTFWTFFISTLAIAGAPFTAGFFSKDSILAEAYARGGPALWLAGALGAGLTAFYMFRQVFLVFFGECRADEETKKHLHESPASMTVPLIILAAGALIVGWLGLPPFMGTSLFHHWHEPVFGHPHHVLSHGTEIALMLASVGLATGGAFLAYLMYYVHRVNPDTFANLAGGSLYRAVYNKYWVDELYDLLFVRGALLIARLGAMFDAYVVDGIVNGSARVTTAWAWVAGVFDLRFIDGAVNGVSDVVLGWGARLRKVQTGSINAYLYAIVAGVVGVMIVQMLWSGGA